MSALGKGDYVLIQSADHRKNGRVGRIVSETVGKFMGTWTVDVDGVEFFLAPHELTKMVPEEGVGTPTPPDLTAEEYNEVMDALMARAYDAPPYALTKILTVADSVKNKFGRNAEHHREPGQ